jgi:maltooligosyltrehalose trehalohydrolase
MSFGPQPTQDGKTKFSLWAPSATSVDLVLQDQSLPMQKQADGWFVLDIAAEFGALYRFRIDGQALVPDPASNFQPQDVHGSSELIDHRYDWQARDWRGRKWNEAVIYELHVGAFSAEGTFRGVIAHLDHLVKVGITAIELMPLADFSGSRNWGYDGVLPFAPDSAYGRPEDLKALIDAAHRRGLMVLLDVVYNHFGPEGNYLGLYAPQFFTDEFSTPWGASIDYRRQEVRQFAIQNVLHWLTIYRFDGLRFDAVHAIRATGEPPILQTIAEAVDELARRENRHIHLVLENDDNAASLLQPIGPYRAQWNDDYHHAWHVLLTGEQDGYYEDYVDPLPRLRRALSSGFAYQGEASQHRGGAKRGEGSARLPPTAFVNFLQNHDQIGNRPFGDRLEDLASPPAIEAALAITLLAPPIPLLFMGEEWGSKQPFPFFCDFTGDLAKAVEEGRRREFAGIYKRATREPPSALDPRTFEDARLDWSEPQQREAGKRLELVRKLLALRGEFIVPLLAQTVRAHAADVPWLQIDWQFESTRLTLLANPSSQAIEHEWSSRRAVWGAASGKTLAPWQVVWLLEPQ